MLFRFGGHLQRTPARPPTLKHYHFSISATSNDVYTWIPLFLLLQKPYQFSNRSKEIEACSWQNQGPFNASYEIPGSRTVFSVDGNGNERETVTEKAAFTMFKDTLSLIKWVHDAADAAQMGVT